MRNTFSFSCLVVATILLSPALAGASTITAYEHLEDLTCVTTNVDACTDSIRDLFRSRSNSTTEGNDLILASAPGPAGSGGNSIGASFGLYDGNDLTYTHSVNWLPTSTFLSAQLTIWAYDVNGQNDEVFADSIDLGSLTEGNRTFTTANFPIIVLSLQDGLLNIFIDKHPPNDEINVFASRLTVTYEDAQQLPQVPEPASMILLGTGLLAAGARLRRRT